MNEVARVPLFDRLVDLDPREKRESRPYRTLDRHGLRESVRRELERLFNCRCPLPAAELRGRERTVVDYGLPDLAVHAPASHEDRERLAAILREAIAAFEPRLEGPTVRVEPVAGEGQALAARVEGRLVTEGVAESVAFATVLTEDPAEVTLDAGE